MAFYRAMDGWEIEKLVEGDFSGGDDDACNIVVEHIEIVSGNTDILVDDWWDVNDHYKSVDGWEFWQDELAPIPDSITLAKDDLTDLLYISQWNTEGERYTFDDIDDDKWEGDLRDSLISFLGSYLKSKRPSYEFHLFGSRPQSGVVVVHHPPDGWPSRI